jgi:hypothetical protein
MRRSVFETRSRIMEAVHELLAKMSFSVRPAITIVTDGAALDT